MGSRITVRYFRVMCATNYDRSFRAALQEVFQLPHEQRAKLVSGTGYRLEHLEEQGGLLKGEVIKIQDDNLPAVVTPEGLSPLDVDKLGYGTAFVYDESLSTLAIQYDNRIVSPARIGGYLRAHYDHNRFRFEPIPRNGAWARFEDSGVKKFIIKVAVPQTFAGVDDEGFDEHMHAMAAAYGAPYITVEVGVGRRNLTLSDSIKDMARRWIGSEPVMKMKAKTVEGAHEIDLLDEMLKDVDEIEIPADPEMSYSARSNLVYNKLMGSREYIASIYG